MAVFYKRNTDIYISKAPNASANATNTVKLSVKDFSYNQNSNTVNVGRETLDPTQARTIAPHISVIAPVNFSFTTYVLPLLDTNVTSPEEYLWLSLMGAASGITSSSTSFIVDFAEGNVDTLANLTLWFDQPNQSEGNYRLDFAIVDSASISFGINDIATIVWSGRALSISEDNIPPAATDRTGETNYLKNRLSTISLNMNAVAYTLALTGGQINFNNNNNFYGRTKLGETTVATGHFTGNRNISGTLDFYMKSGTNQSVDLFNTLLTNASTSTYEETYTAAITINVGGETAPYLQVNVPQSILQLGRQNFGDLITVSIPFTAKEGEGGVSSSLDPLYGEVVLLAQFDETLITPDYSDLGENAANSWLYVGSAATNANMQSTGILSDSGQSTMAGFDVSPDGLHVIICDTNTDKVRSYTLDSAYDFENATVDNTGGLNFTNPAGSLRFLDSGSKFMVYRGAASSGKLSVHATDSAYKLTSTGAPTSLSEVLQNEIPFGSSGLVAYWMSEDGTHLFAHCDDPANSNAETIFHFNLSTPYNVTWSTSMTLSEKFSTSGVVGISNDIRVSGDGTVIYIRNNDVCDAYVLSTPWDVSTATFQEDLPIAGQEFRLEYAGTLGTFSNPGNDFIPADGLTWYIQENAGDIYAWTRNISSSKANQSYEESSLANRLDFRNQASIDTTTFKFGSGSAAFDQYSATYSTDCIKVGHDTADWSAYMLDGGDDFCIEGWIYFDALETVHDTYSTLIAHALNIGNKNFEIYMRVLSGSQYLYVKVGTVAETVILPTQPVVDTWYHFGIQRRGTSLDLLWHGDRVATNAAYGFAGIANPSKPIDIGAWDSTGADNYIRGIQGKIDSVRFTNGSSRYPDATTYTVPTSTFFGAGTNYVNVIYKMP